MKTIVADISMLNDLVEIENLSFSAPWSKKSFEEAFESDNINIFALVDDDAKVIGFACLLAIEYEAEILNIAVSESFRGKGCGSILMEHIITECSRNDVDSIFLEVRESNISARALYSKFGFKELGVRKKYYTSPVEDAILMQKDLTEDKD